LGSKYYYFCAVMKARLQKNIFWTSVSKVGCWCRNCWGDASSRLPADTVQVRLFAIVSTRVLDPDWFTPDLDLDPAFFLNLDPDPMRIRIHKGKFEVFF
jgi:hypothetical protein